MDPRAPSAFTAQETARPANPVHLHLFGPLPDFFLLGPGFTLLVSATLSLAMRWSPTG